MADPVDEHDQHGIENEPQHDPRERARRSATDPSEETAARALEREAAAGDAEEALARHSVFNEPGSIFPPGSPARGSGVAERSWSCDHCGYNLRGLEIGERCPECGGTPVYHPTPENVVSYGSWLQKRIDEHRARRLWPLALGLAIAGGLWAVVGSVFLEAFSLSGDVLGLVVLAPVFEETMKIAALATILERRPYLFRSRANIMAIAVASAVGFATIENALYLFVYTTAPSPALIAWRVVVCTALHVVCTTLAATGLVRVWRRSVTELREPDLTPFTGALVLAIVVHAVYNAGMLGLSLGGWSL